MLDKKNIDENIKDQIRIYKPSLNQDDLNKYKSINKEFSSNNFMMIEEGIGF